MTKKKDSKANQDNVSELEEVQDNIAQSEEELDLEEEVEPSACLLYTSPSPRDS